MATILTTDELEAICLEAAKNPAFLATLTVYETQALTTFARDLSERLAERSDDEQYELWELYPPCGAADTVLRLLAKHSTTAAATAPAAAPATAVTTVIDEWAGLLLNNFTLDELDKLIVNLGLVDNQRIVEKPACWKGLVAGLITRKKLKNNKAKIARALNTRYGEVCSERTLQGSIGNNTPAEQIMERTKALVN